MKQLETAEQYIRLNDAAREHERAGLPVPFALATSRNQLGARLDQQTRADDPRRA